MYIALFFNDHLNSHNVRFFNYHYYISSPRTSRTNCGRKNFKVDSLLDRLEQKLKESSLQDGLLQEGFMTITFLGYYDSKKGQKYLEGSIPVELVLLKACHKKRKETPYLMESVGSVDIPCNPSEDHPPNKAPALSVSSESLTTSNGHQVIQSRSNNWTPGYYLQ